MNVEAGNLLAGDAGCGSEGPGTRLVKAVSHVVPEVSLVRAPKDREGVQKMHRCHVSRRFLFTLLVLSAFIALLLAALAPAAMAIVVPAPTVTATSPTSGATNVILDGTITATFSVDINPLTITTASFFVTALGDSSQLPATVSYNSTTKTATLTPKADLTPGTWYVVTIASTVQGTSGLGLAGAPVTWSFITVATPAPQVTNRIPAPGASNQALNQVISVSFDSDMNPATLTSANFYIAKFGGSPLAATIKYYGGFGSGIATLTPTVALDPNATYQVTLTKGVRGANGRYISGAPIVWSFTTVAGQPPQVTALVPTNGAQDRPVGQTISVSFDKDMNASTITAASFYVASSPGGSPLAAAVAYNAATKIATLVPVASLAPATTYQVTLTAAVKSTTGQSVVGAPVVWTFKTANPPLSFSDVLPGSPYATAIYQIASLGIMKGFDDGTFQPNSPVLRQQFAKMIVLALGLPVSQNDIGPFTDVEQSTPGHLVDPADPLYPDHYVAVAAAHGVTQGITPTLFDPFGNISRYQAITMVVRGISGLQPGLLQTPPASYQSTWDPTDSTEHGQNARLAEFNGLLDGLPLESLDPFAPMSRGEVAQVLWSLEQLMQP